MWTIMQGGGGYKYPDYYNNLNFSERFDPLNQRRRLDQPEVRVNGYDGGVISVPRSHSVGHSVDRESGYSRNRYKADNKPRSDNLWSILQPVRRGGNYLPDYRRDNQSPSARPPAQSRRRSLSADQTRHAYNYASNKNESNNNYNYGKANNYNNNNYNNNSNYNNNYNNNIANVYNKRKFDDHRHQTSYRLNQRIKRFPFVDRPVKAEVSDHLWTVLDPNRQRGSRYGRRSYRKAQERPAWGRQGGKRVSANYQQSPAGYYDEAVTGNGGGIRPKSADPAVGGGFINRASSGGFRGRGAQVSTTANRGYESPPEYQVMRQKAIRSIDDVNANGYTVQRFGYR